MLLVKDEAGFPDGRGERVGVSPRRYSLLSLMDAWGKSTEARGQDGFKVGTLGRTVWLEGSSGCAGEASERHSAVTEHFL